MIIVSLPVCFTSIVSACECMCDSDIVKLNGLRERKPPPRPKFQPVSQFFRLVNPVLNEIGWLLLQ